MAKAMIIDDDYGALAVKYYAKIPDEPISVKSSLKIDSTQTIKQTSILKLLELIISIAKTGDDIVLVSHGNDEGLTMPLIPKYGRNGQTNNLNILMSGETVEKIAEPFAMKPDIMKDLLSKADAVRKIKLGHVAFRGCSIGGQERNLIALKDFLGATAVSGTSLLSTFGHAPPRVLRAAQFEASWKSAAGKAHLSGDKGKRVIFFRSPGKEAYTEIISLSLESEDALLPWLKTYFLAGATNDIAVSMKNDAPVHYLLYTPAILPLDKGSVGYADFIFTK